MTTTIRKYQEPDAPALAQLFYDSVRQGAIAFYTLEQVEAWAPIVPDADEWAARLSSQQVYVAEDASGITGYMTLVSSGYIDFAFVRPDRIGQGVGKALYTCIERVAIRDGLEMLTTEASEMAWPFFERLGWELVKRQTIERRGVVLTNYRMRKNIGSKRGITKKL